MPYKMRDGTTVNDRRLGRLEPTDWEHVEKWPLTAAAAPPGPRPVVFGINWYRAFSQPERVGNRYYIGRGDLGRVDGGHAIASFRPARDTGGWYTFYDQGQEGACVGFSESRMMSVLNRRRYGARWLYKEAQRIDEWPGEQYSGTSVRAGLEILRTRGHCRVRGKQTYPEGLDEGIEAYRWLTSVDEIHDTIGVKGSAIPLLNSWGRSYPRVVYMPDEVVDRVLRESGECAVVTDR